MQNLLNKIEENLDSLTLLTISNPRKAQEIKKYSIRPVIIKDTKYYQSAGYTKTQVYHENLKKEELCEKLKSILPLYKQVLLKLAGEEVTALVNKQGKASMKVRKLENPGLKIDPSQWSHNRQKKYILQEGMQIPFMEDLGVMTKDGKIVRKKYDKFRQINRFLEFVKDVLPYLPKDREITILDFGCGKSYLTFAVYYYLKIMNQYDVRIIGLDLKSDVIRKCNQLSEKYGYSDKLNFLQGAIEDYEGVDQVDMVVTLHACDTATDYALYKAIKWKSKVILSVPCCQHELNSQIHLEDRALNFDPIMDYGILRERFSAMATDGIRAKILESMGYDTQILEFIDMEHTPKNLLIRAVLTRGASDEKCEKIKEFCVPFGFKPTLLRLLQEGE